MSKFWSALCNAFTSGSCGFLVLMQVDENNWPLYRDFHGLFLVALILLGMSVFNVFRAMQVCVYGEEF